MRLYFFDHPDFDGLIHVACHCVQVDVEGDPSDFSRTLPSPRQLSHENSPASSNEEGNVDDKQGQ